MTSGLGSEVLFDQPKHGDLPKIKPFPLNGRRSGIPREIITITGKAKGMDPAAPTGTYFSIIYDVGSFAKGFGACEPFARPTFDMDAGI